MLRLPTPSGADRLAGWRLQREVRADERRREPRKAVYIAALMNAAGVEHKCTVLDISASGARIAVARPKSLPDDVLVCIRRRIHKCKVIWRSDCEIGVAFVIPD
jgi:hypothetical protein